MDKYRVDIVGSGPAGLAAALYLARAGYTPVVFEPAHEVGALFQGDFQALENWTGDHDLSNMIAGLGIQPNFRCVPFTGGKLFGPRGQEHTVSHDAPLFYLVERGRHDGSLDQGLKQQALNAGAEIRSGQRLEHSEARNVIVTRGAQAPSALVRGLVFETSHPDAFFGFANEDDSPHGYGYLIIREGRGTFVSALFEDFSRLKQQFDKTLARALDRVPFDIYAPRTFGGHISLSSTPPWSRDDRFYYAGERAGFQHALWGFDLRLALLSGVMAARAIAMHEDYEELGRTYMAPEVMASLEGWQKLGVLSPHEHGAGLEGLLAEAFFPALRSTPGKEALLDDTPAFVSSPDAWPCRDEDYTCLWHQPSIAEPFDHNPLKKPACAAGQRCKPLESYHPG